MKIFKCFTIPDGEIIKIKNNKLEIPNFPIIPRIIGDGIGRDISKAAYKVFDKAIENAYGKRKKIIWLDIPAGEYAFNNFGEYLPTDTIEALKTFIVSIKGPLTTPVGKGFRSLNVALRQTLDLYACIRPIRWFEGIAAPVKNPEALDVIIFRENTEDVYAGIEYKKDSPEIKKIRRFLSKEFGTEIRGDSGIGIKPISEFGSKRLVRMAINHSISKNKPSVTIVHKGNIMKFTEGAFRDWGYEVAKGEFGGKIITENDLIDKFKGKCPKGKIIIKDRIADAMFHDLLISPETFSVIAATNLNGDYLSDACAAQVGGLGIAPGANVGNIHAVFEATHGTAPKLADKNIANPGSLVLSGVMMFEYLGWNSVAEIIFSAFKKTIKSKKVTTDLAINIKGARQLTTTEFGDEIIKNMR